MEVILLQDLDHVGYKDEVVKVKPGFARNYLIPQQLALVANVSNRKALEEKLRQQENKIKKMIAEYETQASKIEKDPIKVGAKVGTSGKIFGSITHVQLADAIKNQTGVEVDRKKVRLIQEVKTLGTYEAEVELHKDVTANFEFEVISI